MRRIRRGVLVALVALPLLGTVTVTAVEYALATHPAPTPVAASAMEYGLL